MSIEWRDIVFWRRTRAAAMDRNFGANIAAWPERLDAAWSLFQSVVPCDEPREVGDYGCGRQLLREKLPAGWRYVPYDWTERSSDTVICDFNKGLPSRKHDVIFCLGLMEYLNDPLVTLRHMLQQAPTVVFSCTCGFQPLRTFLQGWKGTLNLRAVRLTLESEGMRVLADVRRSYGVYLFVCTRL